MRQIASVITTSPETRDSGIGTRPGEHGLAIAESSRISAWLSKQRPTDMDKAAVSRASQHGVGLQVRYESRYPTGPNGERLDSYVVATGCQVSPDGNHSAALADLWKFMTPAPIREIEGWLAVLSVTVAKRKDDEFAEELRLTTYASRLARYPADVVREVTHATYTFWPTWAEMEKRCESLTSPRRQMIAALERGPDKPEPARRPPTQEERDRIQAMIDQMFPSKSQADRARAVNEALQGNCMRVEA